MKLDISSVSVIIVFHSQIIQIVVVSALLVTGGSYSEKSVELLQETNSVWTSCSLPDLPDRRVRHTQSGAVVCGGAYTTSSCLTFSSSGWTQSHTLLEERAYHSTWKSPHGQLLMGGSYSRWTTELLHEDGTSSKHFELEYDTV